MKGYKKLTHKEDIYYVDVINDKHEIVCSPKSDYDICVVLSAQKIVKLLNRLVELENAIESGELCDREEARKETAQDILKRINKYYLNYNYDLKREFEKLCKDYGVDLEDEQ